MLRPKGTNLHYEVELALMMGKTVRDLDPEDEKGALDAIKSSYQLNHLSGYDTMLMNQATSSPST